MSQLDFAFRLVTITLINLALSGDNAIVIGMAAASLPHRQRRAAIIGGGLLAVGLRLALTTVASRLTLVPLIDAIGGAVLFVVAWGLLKVDADHEADPAESPHGLRKAIELILIADLTMSLDNVLAVAGAAHGDDGLVIGGLLISMPILMVAGGLVSALIDRFPWVIYIGAGAITMTGARMVMEDELVGPLAPWDAALDTPVSLLVALALPLVYLVVQRRRSHGAAADTGRAPGQGAAP